MFLNFKLKKNISIVNVRYFNFSLTLLNHYKTLGVCSTATKEEIKKAYIKLANLHHPDKHKGDKDKEELFKKINNAYGVIGKDKERKQYDLELKSQEFIKRAQGGSYEYEEIMRKRSQTKKPSEDEDSDDEDSDFFHSESGGWANFGVGGMGGMDFDPEDIFGAMHGFYTGSRRRKKKQPIKKKAPPFDQSKLNIHIDVEVTLEELYNGATKQIQYVKNCLCKTCKGFGTKTNLTKTCGNCGGKGTVVMNKRGYELMSCNDCGGTGKIILRKDKCGDCNGHKTIRVTETVPLVIPVGTFFNDLIIDKGLGHEHIDFHQMDEKQMRGDLHFHLKEFLHPVFERSGIDLLVNKTISLSEALGGFNFKLKLLDGKEMEFRSPKEGKIVQPGTVFFVKGKGLPRNKYKNTSGNLFIKFNVEFPNRTFLSDEAIKVLQNALLEKPTPKQSNQTETETTTETEPNEAPSQKSGPRIKKSRQQIASELKAQAKENRRIEKMIEADSNIIHLTEIPFFSKLPKFSSLRGLNYSQEEPQQENKS